MAMVRWDTSDSLVHQYLLLSPHLERKRRKANVAKKFSLSSKVVSAFWYYVGVEFKLSPSMKPQETEARIRIGLFNGFLLQNVLRNAILTQCMNGLALL